MMAGFACTGWEGRTQKAEGRSEKHNHAKALFHFCLLTSAFCLLPSAFCAVRLTTSPPITYPHPPNDFPPLLLLVLYVATGHAPRGGALERLDDLENLFSATGRGFLLMNEIVDAEAELKRLRDAIDRVDDVLVKLLC